MLVRRSQVARKPGTTPARGRGSLTHGKILTAYATSLETEEIHWSDNGSEQKLLLCAWNLRCDGIDSRLATIEVTVEEEERMGLSENTILPEIANADGLPATELSEEQRYRFDTQGWLCIPGLLEDDEVAEMREFAYQLARDPESIPESERSTVGGPLQNLVDHPAVVGFMNEFVAHEPLASPDGYGFRLEGTFLTIRPSGPGNKKFGPHGGSGFLNFPGNHHTYHIQRGRANSGLTRVVWELNPIVKGDGGTIFLTGSHKAAFDRPKCTDQEDHSLWDTYECPAGSVLFFTEAITHSAVAWKSSERERCAIFNCYNTVGSKWHTWEPPEAVFETMPRKRQSLFRPVYCQNNTVNPGDQINPGNGIFPNRFNGAEVKMQEEPRESAKQAG